VRWLLSLQTTFIDPDTPPTTDLTNPPPAATNLSDDEEELDNEAASISKPQQQPQKDQQNSTPSTTLHQSPDKSTMWAPNTLNTTLLISTSTLTPTPHSGMCGRPCKPADTCYAFWAGASLSLLSSSHLSSAPALRHYLLALTQHPIMGGFSKFPGDKWADLYHSYLGLAALSLVSTAAERETDGIKDLDAGMCVSADVRGRLKGIWEGFEG
jgi:geranylgeranyl transferase type-1 subunit beta